MEFVNLKIAMNKVILYIGFSKMINKFFKLIFHNKINIKKHQYYVHLTDILHKYKQNNIIYDN